jgi:hypothetical protein
VPNHFALSRSYAFREYRRESIRGELQSQIPWLFSFTKQRPFEHDPIHTLDLRRFVVRRLIPLIAGFGIGFAIVAATVSATALFVIGVGGHLLARSDQSAATTISFDPGTVAARSPIPAAIAVLLLILFVIVYLRLRGAERRSSQRAPLE